MLPALDARRLHLGPSGENRYVAGLVDGLVSLGGLRRIRIYAHGSAPLPRSARIERRSVLDAGGLRADLLAPAPDRPDLLHATGPPGDLRDAALLGLAPATVLTVHDLHAWRDAGDFDDGVAHRRYRVALEFAVRAADRIIVPSEATRRALLAVPGAAPGRISLVPHGVEGRFHPLETPEAAHPALERHGIGGRYLLAVADDRAHRNLLGLLTAFRLFLPEAPRDLRLVVLAGPPHPGRRRPVERLLAEDRALAGRTILHIHVDEDDLPAIYGSALAVIAPSLEEGFGFAALEALASGAPLIAHDGGALPEVVGDAALLVDASDPAELKRAILRVVTDGNLRRTLARLGPGRARAFTWRATAARTVEVHAGAVESRRTASAGRDEALASLLPELLAEWEADRAELRSLRAALSGLAPSVGRLPWYRRLLGALAWR